MFKSVGNRIILTDKDIEVMREFFELIHTYNDEAAGLAMFLLIVIWYICDTIGNIFKNKNK